LPSAVHGPASPQMKRSLGPAPRQPARGSSKPAQTKRLTWSPR
jgi:hypothetical protein